MTNATTLTELIEGNRTIARSIYYVEGENDFREVSYGELYERALGILYHLQRIGAKRGDKLILLLANNEQFLDAYWAAILGGIIPVPVAPGISDEHRHKLLRIARKLGNPFIYSERKLLDRIGSFASQAGESDAGFKSAGVLRLYERRLGSMYRDASNSELKSPYRYGNHTWTPVPGWLALFPAHLPHEVSVVRSPTSLILVFAKIRFVDANAKDSGNE